MADTVESMLARNCAPVLAGIKPSNLFSCPASCGIQLTEAYWNPRAFGPFPFARADRAH